MKPLIIYVDDEPHNLTVFEAALPDDWEVLVFDSPLEALNRLPSLSPCIVASDQRMPGMAGVNFLEIVKKTHPEAKRVLVTGYSEEDLVVDSIRKAGVHDYIRKPWDVEDLLHRMTQMLSTFQLESSLREQASLLERKNSELSNLAEELRKAKGLEEMARKELEAWAPPFLLKTIEGSQNGFPIKRDLALITFDIVGSSEIHDLYVGDKGVRSLVLKEFSESVIKHGGWRESHSGDSAYAHFGLLEGVEKPAVAALSVASEFRTFLRSFAVKNRITIECGIGLHFAKDVAINIHTAEIMTKAGNVIQKSFDSSSRDVDLVHRLEKLTHAIPGSNIIMSKAFVDSLDVELPGMVDIGDFRMKGQPEDCRVFLKPSDLVKAEHIELLSGLRNPEKKAA